MYVYMWNVGYCFIRQSFVKRFALCCRSVASLSVLSVLSVCVSICDVDVLWPNTWMDQDETWHGGRSRLRPHCVRWGPSSLFPKEYSPPPIFGPCLLWSNSWLDQDATWYGGRPRPGDIVLDGTQLLLKRGTAPTFRPMSIVAKRLDVSRCHLVRR